MSDDAIDLLVIGNTTPEIEFYLDEIRNAGVAAHATRIDHDAEQLGKTLKSQRSLDILIYTLEGDEFGVSQLFGVLSVTNPHLPVVAVAEELDKEIRLELMRQGIADLVIRMDAPHLAQVVLREYKHLMKHRRMQQIERQLQEAEDRCNALTESSRDAIAYVHEGMHVTANHAYMELFGLASEEEIEGLPILDMIAHSEHKAFKKLLRDLSADSEYSTEMKTKCLRSDDKEFSAELIFTPASIEGEPCTQVVIRDQSVSREVEEKLRLLSTQDVQTGLYNRQYFLNLLESETRNQCDSGNNKKTLLYITLDNFSEIRNNSGLKACDALLSEIADLLRKNVGRENMLSRFGDRTFAILAPGDRPDEATQLAQHICDLLNNHDYQDSTLDPKPRCCIGIAFTSEQIGSGHEFITQAYNACEKARNEGIDLYAMTTGEALVEQDVAIASETSLEHQIDVALENNQFYLAYQPIVSLHGDTRENYAVTLQLKDDNLQEIASGDFLSQAAAKGKALELDRWLIRNAIKELTNQRKQGQKINFFINISGASLEDETLLLYICDCLRDYEAKGAWITFQVDDSDARTHLQRLKKLSEGLKKIKCKLSIDQFGLAKKPESILNELPLDFVQFDDSFLDGLSENQERQDKLNKLNSVTQEKNIKTIASGVEEASSLAILWTIGVNYIRGHFIQEPTEKITYDFAGE
jgi:diguanylate cyclase (GGDEF)-like protein/PAS domain S-box-containing protein